MYRLLINPESEAAWTATLRPGRNCLGRAEDCDVVLDHPSISAQHAEIEVSGGRTLFRDLSTARGSWVGEERVIELELQPGLEIRLGEVMVRVEADPDGPPVGEPVANEQPVVMRHCQHHLREAARWHCPGCGRDFCEACVSTHRQGGSWNHFCRACGGRCEPLAVAANWVNGAPEAETRFLALLPGVFAYPFRGNGPVLLAAGSAFLLVVRVVGTLSGPAAVLGLIAGVIVGVFAGGYLFNYCKRIIETTANGEDALPDWPDFTDWMEDALRPFIQLLALLLFVYGPWLMLGFVTVPDPRLATALAWATLVAAGVLAPMALLALTIYDRFAALNPVLLLPSMARCPVDYGITVAGFVGLMAVVMVVESLLDWLLPLPLLPGFLATILGFYFQVVAMRVVGVFYRAHREDLGWMK